MPQFFKKMLRKAFSIAKADALASVGSLTRAT
jgi:hypothetical protein